MNEIEEFLKRAAAMRARQPGAQPAPPRPPVSPPPTPLREAPVAPLSRFAPSAEVQDAEVVEAEEVTGDQVSAYVSRHLDSGLFKERASHLGEVVRSTDEAIESHLHETFEHRLGRLGASTARAEDSTLDDEETAAAKAASVQVPALTFSALLRSPQNLRNAIILSEILNPPHIRW